MKESWKNAESYFVALEWCDGGEIFDYVRDVMAASEKAIAAMAHQPQVPAESLNQWQNAVKSIFKQLIEGVGFLHLHGVCHRDLSLENTLMADRRSTHIKIIDFGVAKAFSDGNFRCHETERIGKLGYMAPEVCVCVFA